MFWESDAHHFLALTPGFKPASRGVLTERQGVTVQLWIRNEGKILAEPGEDPDQFRRAVSAAIYSLKFIQQ